MLKNERFRDRFKSVFRKISNFKLKYEYLIDKFTKRIQDKLSFIAKA